MIDSVFRLCVDILVWLAGIFGVSYEAVNVAIFCVLWPLLTLFMALVIWCQRTTINQLKS
jgi:hypothetical protein